VGGHHGCKDMLDREFPFLQTIHKNPFLYRERDGLVSMKVASLNWPAIYLLMATTGSCLRLPALQSLELVDAEFYNFNDLAALTTADLDTLRVLKLIGLRIKHGDQLRYWRKLLRRIHDEGNVTSLRIREEAQDDDSVLVPRSEFGKGVWRAWQLLLLGKPTKYYMQKTLYDEATNRWMQDEPARALPSGVGWYISGVQESRAEGSAAVRRAMTEDLAMLGMRSVAFSCLIPVMYALNCSA